MEAKVINFAEWKAAHPPMLNIWSAHYRCVSAWWTLFFQPFLR